MYYQHFGKESIERSFLIPNRYMSPGACEGFHQDQNFAPILTWPLFDMTLTRLAHFNLLLCP